MTRTPGNKKWLQNIAKKINLPLYPKKKFNGEEVTLMPDEQFDYLKQGKGLLLKHWKPIKTSLKNSMKDYVVLEQEQSMEKQH